MHHQTHNKNYSSTTIYKLNTKFELITIISGFNWTENIHVFKTFYKIWKNQPTTYTKRKMVPNVKLT